MEMEMVVKKMAMNSQNSQGSGNCDVLDDTDLLEKILVRLPHESVFSCILVSKRWFGLICGSCFREHYIRRWSDEVNLMRSSGVSAPNYMRRLRDVLKLMHSAELSEHYLGRLGDEVKLLQLEPYDEEGELQRQLESQQLVALNQLQHRLQSQQLAALDQLQHRLSVNQLQRLSFDSMNESLHQLHPQRVAALNKLHNKLELALKNLSKTVIDDKTFNVLNENEELKIFNCLSESKELMCVNKLQLQEQSRVLAEVRESVKELPSQRWAAVNEVQHQIVCQLLVKVNVVQCLQYDELVYKPLRRSLVDMHQQKLLLFNLACQLEPEQKLLLFHLLRQIEPQP